MPQIRYAAVRDWEVNVRMDIKSEFNLKQKASEAVPNLPYIFALFAHLNPWFLAFQHKKVACGLLSANK